MGMLACKTGNSDFLFLRVLAWAAISVVLGTPSVAQSQASQPSTLRAAKAFDLLTIVPSTEQQAKMAIHGLRTSQAGVYFLVSDNPRVQNSRIIHTDYRGIYQGLLQLPPTAGVLDFDVDNNGSLFVMVYDRAVPSHPTILIYRPDGTPDHSLATSKTATALSLVGQQLMILSQSTAGTQLLLAGETAAIMMIPLNVPTTRAFLNALPDGRVLIVEPTAAVIHFVDPGSQSIADFSPRVPEMAWLSTLSPTMGNQAVASGSNVGFSSVAVSSSGEVFALIGHYRLADGAPVLNFHINGNLSATVRCILPEFTDEKNPNNQAGEMVPRFISTIGSMLILASSSGKVALYAL